MRKYLVAFLRYALVAACILYAFWGLDWPEFGQALKRFGPFAILGILAYSFFQYVLVALRLDYLSGFKAGFLTSFKASLFCLGINNLFPAKLGEVAKAFYLRRETGISLGKGLGMIFWERFFDLNSLLTMGLISALFLRKNLAVVPLGAVVGGIWVCLIVFRIFPAASQLLVKLVPNERLRLLFSDVLHQLQEHVRPSFFVILGAYSAVVWIAFAGQTYLAALWMGDLKLTVVQVLIVFVVSSLGYAVPSTPGALGVFEAAFILAAGWFGVSKESALAVALVLRFVVYVPPIVAAFYIMAKSGLTLKTIREKGEETL